MPPPPSITPLHVWAYPDDTGDVAEQLITCLQGRKKESAGIPIVLLSASCEGEQEAQLLAETLQKHQIQAEVVNASLLMQEPVLAGGSDATDNPMKGGLHIVPLTSLPPSIPKTAALDTSATALAAALNADSLTVWRTSGGIFSADPRLCTEAFELPNLSYQEAAEIADLNAGILSASALQPLKELAIPIYVRSPLTPSSPGTTIGEPALRPTHYGTAVTAQQGMALIVVEGMGLKGVHGLVARTLFALSHQAINIVMLSQSSTEQSIGIVIRQEEAPIALEAIHGELEPELFRNDVNRIYALDDVGIVTVVDENMRYRPGLAGRLFSTLARSGINVLTLADGASETNIVAVVSSADLPRAVRSLHEAFAVGRNRAHVFLFGAGTVGKILLKLLTRQVDVFRDKLNLNLQLVGLANSRHMVWDTEGIPYAEALGRLEAAADPIDTRAIIHHLLHSRLERLIVIDATASDEIAQLYPDLLENQISVITPNKRANTLSYAFYKRVREAAVRNHVPYFYETTVGAGLPVISTLRDLIRSGDEIQRIEGVFSGTMGFLFNRVGEGVSFADAVLEARSRGYSEPDPREDLAGTDVARKLVILARELGLEVDLDAVSVESLVPPSLENEPLDAFLEQLPRVPDPLKTRIQQAQSRNARLQYIGSIQNGHLDVSIAEVDSNSPFNQLKGTDNLIVFHTRWYQARPLVIQGPGAGPEVTAAGILADLIKAAELVA